MFRDPNAGLERGKAQRTEREISWLTKLAARTQLSNTHPHPAQAAATPALAPVPARHVLPAPRRVALAAANSSGAKRCASSAPRRSMRSRTATSVCSSVLSPSAARSFRAVCPVYAHGISAALALRLSSRATSLCLPSLRGSNSPPTCTIARGLTEYEDWLKRSGQTRRSESCNGSHSE